VWAVRNVEAGIIWSMIMMELLRTRSERSDWTVVHESVVMHESRKDLLMRVKLCIHVFYEIPNNFRSYYYLFLDSHDDFGYCG